jgi:isoleucyl-tRNA synthetase
MEDIDEWAIEQTDLLVAECAEAYRNFGFGAVITAVHNFCGREMSRFYIDAIKDRMYCDGADWPARRSAQAACHYTLLNLVRLVTPILPFTAEEVYARIPAIQRLRSVHLEVLEVPSEERLRQIEGSERQMRFASLIAERADVFAAFEVWKTESEVKDSQDVVVTYTNSTEQLVHLRSFAPVELANLFKMSEVELVEGDEAIAFRISEYPKCERSRLRRADVREINGHWLTERDARAVGWA